VGKSALIEKFIERNGLERRDQAKGLTIFQLADGIQNSGQGGALGGAKGANIEFGRSRIHGGYYTGKPTYYLDSGQCVLRNRLMPSANDDQGFFRQTAIIATLRRSRMFTNLSSEDIAAVAEGCVTRVLQKGEAVFHEGDKSEGFYVVQTGAVSIYRLTPDGREQIICVFRAPESFAEGTLATIESYPANAVALEPSQVILIRKKNFLELIRHKPELSLNMLASMSLHLNHLVQSIQDIKGRQIEFRLADWLLRQSPGTKAGCPAVIELPISKKTLAGQLGVTSETLSRTFARFRREGAIAVSGATVTITDGSKLRAYID